MSSYPQVIISASTPLSFPAETEGEKRRNLWVAGAQHQCSLEASWKKEADSLFIHNTRSKLDIMAGPRVVHVQIRGHSLFVLSVITYTVF